RRLVAALGAAGGKDRGEDDGEDERENPHRVQLLPAASARSFASVPGVPSVAARSPTPPALRCSVGSFTRARRVPATDAYCRLCCRVSKRFNRLRRPTITVPSTLAPGSTPATLPSSWTSRFHS